VITRALAAAVLVAFVGTALAQPPKLALPGQPKVGKEDAKADKPDPAKQLAARVTIEKFAGKFKDAVAMFIDKYELPLVVDPRVGEETALAACDAPADDKPVKLPKLVNVRLDTALKLVAEQVGGKFLVYPDHVKIVPAAFAEYESGVLSTTPDAGEEALLPTAELIRARPLIKRGLVNVSFKNKPLSEALDEIAEATGATIAVSPLLPANVRQAAVTVRFANTPVEAAVRTLCEMTECAVIEDANVLLVTTRERVATRAKEDAQKLRDRQPPPVVIAPGGLGGGLGVAGLAPQQPDLAAELARLKEQNEQLRKELEEIKKLLKK
jgi:hypothetical protein